MPSHSLAAGARRLRRLLLRPGRVLAVFLLPSSAACRDVQPLVEDVAPEIADRVTVVPVSDLDGASLAADYAVTVVPTLVLFDDGREVERIEGTVGPATIRAHVEFLLAQEPVRHPEPTLP